MKPLEGHCLQVLKQMDELLTEVKKNERVPAYWQKRIESKLASAARSVADVMRVVKGK